MSAVALAALTAAMSLGGGESPPRAWMVVSWSDPAHVIEVCRARGHQDAGEILARLFGARFMREHDGAESGDGGRPVLPWGLDPGQPMLLGFSWYPRQRFLVGVVSDPEAALSRLQRLLDEEGVMRRIGPHVVVPAQSRTWVLRGQRLAVAGSGDRAIDLLTHADDLLGSWAPRPGLAVAGADDADLRAMVTFDLDHARNALPETVAGRDLERLRAAPLEGPLSRSLLVMATLVHVVPDSMAERPYEVRVAADGGVLLVPAGAGDMDVPGEGDGGDILSLAGRGPYFEQVARLLPVIGLAADLRELQVDSLVQMTEELLAMPPDENLRRARLSSDSTWNVESLAPDGPESSFPFSVRLNVGGVVVVRRGDRQPGKTDGPDGGETWIIRLPAQTLDALADWLIASS